MVPPGPLDVATLVPSSRDFLQAVRTGRKGLALVPCLAAEEAGREALRMAEAGITALAMREASPAMADAARAVRIPVLSLQPVSTRDDALAARAFGADGVIVDPGLDDAAREATASHARSTRMVALPLARTRAEAERAVARGNKAVVVQAPDAVALAALASAAGRLLVIAWPTAPLADELPKLRGAVDAVVVDVDVYGETGFERLVSELQP
jgi:hypothetical protein